VFDHRDDPFFKTAFPADTSQHDSYVPLTALNHVFPNGRTGLDTLKMLLAHDQNGELTNDTQRPSTRVSSDENRNTPDGSKDTRDGTDITLGFQGAKLAMQGDNNSKENQYFIFLSDGEPSKVDVVRESLKWDFVKGTGIPATFTVFFGDKKVILDSLTKMTNNIIANGYSNSNTKSKMWAINVPANELLTLLMDNVINSILANTPGKATTAVMTVSGSIQNSTAVSATHFTFPKPVALTADQTVVDLKYTYQYTDNGALKTKEVPYTLTVKRSAAATATVGVTPSCREQGTLTLFNKGTQVNVVTADHDNLDVRLTLAAGEVCNGCKVEVKPNKTSDRENVTLSPGSGFQTGNFGRETTTSVKSGDGKLQHVPTDSIIITYVNPDNALDVIRKAFPYSDISTALTMLRHNVIARGGELPSKPGQDFVLVTPGGLNPIPGDSPKNWILLPGFSSPVDSQRYVGTVIEASRAFKVEVQIYSNLGEFVNKTSFSISQEEFIKLAKGVKNNTRQLRVLWGGGETRASNGHLAATGAYIIKTTVTLLAIPGIAEDEAVSTDFRRVGVFRHK
jgi:hypothetical protein